MKCFTAAPIFLLANFNDSLVLKKGTSEKVSIPFLCHPSPTITLQYNAGEVRDTARLHAELNKTSTQIMFESCERFDTGDYLLTLENEFGKASVTVKLTVLGKISVDNYDVDKI